MKFVLAPDSFKESMTAKEAVQAMERGIKKVFPDAECVLIPIADGGEGTVQTLVEALNGELITENVKDPLGRTIEASYGFIDKSKTAIIEVASASGLHLLKPEERNPLKTTSYGTGELIKAALEKGAEHFIVGLGGSAVNDGGVGLLQALGARFLDKNGMELGFGGENLIHLEDIDLSGFEHCLASVSFDIASDVTNPLIGEEGASRVFAPQKGATEEMTLQLDKALTHYAEVVKDVTGKDIAQAEGAGAAGGIGAAFLAFFEGKMQRGVELVLQLTDFANKIKGADYIFTGEGSIDGQTIYGKTIYGVAQEAQKQNIPVIGFGGKIAQEADILYEHGFQALFCILQGMADMETILQNGALNLEKTTEAVCRIIKGSC